MNISGSAALRAMATPRTIVKGLGAAIVLDIVLVAAAFGWVAIYAHGIHPGENVAFYEAYAQVASPWVSILLGPPLFYAVARKMEAHTAIAMVSAYTVIDIAIVTIVAGAGAPWLLVALSMLTKWIATLSAR